MGTLQTSGVRIGKNKLGDWITFLESEEPKISIDDTDQDFALVPRINHPGPNQEVMAPLGFCQEHGTLWDVKEHTRGDNAVG